MRALGAEAGDFSVGISHTHRVSKDLYRGRRKVPNSSNVRTTINETVLHLGYRPMPELELSFAIPRLEIIREENGVSSKTLEGLGDVSFLARWKPWKPDKLFSAKGFYFLAGVELPTGDDGDSPVAGQVAPSVLQLGTGTYDSLLGIGYEGRSGDFVLYHNSIATISGGESDVGLDSGDSLVTLTGLGIHAWEPVFLRASVEGQFLAKDELNGTEISNTGSSVWSLTPAVSVQLADHVTLESSVRIPVAYNVQRTQLVPGTTWEWGLFWYF